MKATDVAGNRCTAVKLVVGTKRVAVDILVVQANNWAGIKQMHARNAVFRSVENGVAMVRQASRGISITYDPAGRILATSDYFTTDQQTMVADVPASGTTTPYSQIGDLFAWACTAAVLALSLKAARPTRNAAQTTARLIYIRARLPIWSSASSASVPAPE